MTLIVKIVRPVVLFKGVLGSMCLKLKHFLVAKPHQYALKTD